ncbi:hypothetical protein FAGAP_7190 [Fusarium agapanthi]|uniref:Uncharacterized protein n=1 Tax=Fusarium agapanthi TaxID=1803897 RepID=A0A9P5B8U4_9HYPO|nr:hypothetical protein FAGAP_7190 [Fusarium agapanthi]
MSSSDPFSQDPPDSCSCAASSMLSEERRRSGRTRMALLACQSRLAFLEAMVADMESQNGQLRSENQRLILVLRHLVPWARIEAPITEQREDASALRLKTNEGGAGSDAE